MRTRKIINLLAMAGLSSVLLVACNSGGGNPNNPNTNQNSNQSNVNTTQTLDSSFSTISAGGVLTFLNPIVSQLGDLAGADAGDVAGELSTDLAVNLLNSMGVTIFNSPQYYQNIQIESQLNAIETQLTSINQSLTTFVNIYYKDTYNNSSQTFDAINSDIYGTYTNFAQDVYAGYPLTQQNLYAGQWESGVIPVIPPESAAIIPLAKSRIYNAYANFPTAFNTEITQLSDDSDNPYVDSNGNLMITENSDGSWTSTRTNSITPGTGWFAANLANAFNNYTAEHPYYGQNNFSSDENLFLNAAQWTQIVKTALFYNDMGLQQSYQIIDSLLRIKYLSGDPELASIDLPSFMGNPASYQNYQQAHQALFEIFKYKQYIIYTEAQQAINNYQTGPNGSQLSNFTFPQGCDDLNQISYEDLVNNPNNQYNWNGKIATTQCTNNNTGVKAYTAQDIGDMCNPGTLANIGGNLYCSSYTGNTLYYGQGGELYNVVNSSMAIDYDAGLLEDDDTIDIRGFNLSTPVSDFGGGMYFNVSNENGAWHVHDGWQQSNFLRLTDQYHVYDVGYGPNPNRSDDGVDMYVYISCVRYDLTCKAVNNSGDSSGPTGYSGISLLYSNGITTNQPAVNEPNVTLNGYLNDEYSYNSYNMFYPATW